MWLQFKLQSILRDLELKITFRAGHYVDLTETGNERYFKIVVLNFKNHLRQL